MDRRSFLTLGSVAALSACSKGIPDFRGIPELRSDVANQTGTIVSNPNTQSEIIDAAEMQEVMANNYAKNHREDLTMIESFLGGLSIQQIQNFQAGNGLTPDGDIGPDTLNAFYALAQARGYNFSPMQYDRMLITTELQNYQSDRERMPTSLPDPYNNKKYFGGGNVQEFVNIPGTHITASLQGLFPVIGNPNTLYIQRIGNGRMTMRLYDKSENLSILAYVTGGTSDHPSPEEVSYTTSLTHKYHISSSYPEEGDLGASMFNATNINGGAIWVHSSADTIDGYDHSHGCFRTGLYYAAALHNHTNRVGSIRVEIGDLY